METLQTERTEAIAPVTQIEFCKERDYLTNSVNFSAYRGEDKLFSALRLYDIKHTVTAWSTNPGLRRTDSLNILHAFYEKLMNGKSAYVEAYVTNFPVGLTAHSKIPSEYSVVPQIGPVLERMNKIPDHQNKTLVFASKYIDFGIELPSRSDYQRLGLEAPSRLERIMFTISEHDISKNLAELISVTSKYPVKEEEIERLLKKAH